MAEIIVDKGFADEVMALKGTLPCGLYPDLNNASCSTIRIETGLSTVIRAYSEFASPSVENVPAVCLHCRGVAAGKYAPTDTVVKEIR